MDAEIIAKKFESIGARVRLGILAGEDSLERVGNRWAVRRGEQPPISVDVDSDKKGEFFQIDLRKDSDYDIIVPSLDKKGRHLLLMVFDRSKPEESPMRFLCGHDERHFFAAAVPESSGASSVYEAKEALKPDAVTQAQAGVKRKHRQKRHSRSKNPVLRQGEWFFVPVNDFEPPSLEILKNEPISRGRGTPHVCEFVYREKGETVYVSSKHPKGLTENEHKKLLEDDPKARRLDWSVMERNAQVYAKGRITHRDHATLKLPTWHRVLPNTESESKAMRFLTFLD